MTHMIMCMDSGISEMKSQKVSCAEAACGISLMRFRLDGMDQVGKLDRVLNEENRNVVADQIKVAFFRIEFDGKSANIARQIGRSTGSGHGREADKDRRLH